jgi:hypothetical protein
MSAVLFNVMIGLATSILSGGSVWVWQRAKNARILRHKSVFFGLKPGATCLIALTSRFDNPKAASHQDVQALIEVANLANEIGCPVAVWPSEELHESNGNRTEFCIGGPGSSPRSRRHLTTYLPGVSWLPYDPSRRDSMAIVAGDRRFLYDRGEREYALAAKFTPTSSVAPVILICGQTAIANRAAINYLKNRYREIENIINDAQRFCLIIRIDATDTYGYQAASLECDISDVAFSDNVPIRGQGWK